MTTCPQCGRTVLTNRHRCPAPGAGPGSSLPAATPPGRPQLGLSRVAPRGGLQPARPLPPPAPALPTAPTSTGPVISRPTVAAGGPEPEALLRPLALVLGLLVVLRTPALLGMLVLPLLLLVAAGWLLGRVGLLGLLALRPRRAPRARPVAQDLAFRWDDGSGPTEVRLRGHDTGVALGDHVSVHGLRRNGVLHATSVENHTTRVVLRRQGLVGLVLLALLDVWLLLALLGS